MPDEVLDSEAIVEDGDPAASGQVEVETPQPSYLDVDSVADHLVTVRIGDEDVAVPVSELRNGYLRQSDYTRKTQETAAQRQEAQAALALANALRDDPEGTLAVLQLQMARGTQQAPAVDPYEDDPYGDQFRTYDSEIDELRAFRDEIVLERNLAKLERQHGNFDAQAVVALALQMGTQDLNVAYKVYAFDQLRAQSEAQQIHTAQQAAQTAAVQAAKTQVAQTVHSGFTPLGGGAPLPDQELSLDQIIAQAMAAQG